MSAQRGGRVRPQTSWVDQIRPCWRCGVDFDITDYTVGAPCIDCQDFLHDVDGDTTEWVRRTEAQLRPGGLRLVYRDPSLIERTTAERAHLRERVLELHDEDHSAFMIAWLLDVTDTWVRRELRRAGLTPHPFNPDAERHPDDVRPALHAALHDEAARAARPTPAVAAVPPTPSPCLKGHPMYTVTDLFAGAGGSSTGAIQVPGVEVRIAANHWPLVTEIHNLNHPNTDHAVVDLHQERPSFFPRTDILWASPECTKWSQASGANMPAIEEGLFEDPLSDDAKNRSRLLMFDVLRFIEHHQYRLVIVENVVDIATQAKYRTAWDVWRSELRALGYRFRVVSLNSMHAQAFGAPAPQSRDRIYIVAWPEAAPAPDLDRILRPLAHCDRCDVVVESVQSFKPGRTVGRYRQAYLYCCSRCGAVVEPGWLPASTAIDWSIPGQRIGDRLAAKTRARVAAGIARYWRPLTLEAAGNSYDSADPRHPRHGDPDGYFRSWPIEEPLRALHTTNSKALAVPVEGRDGKEAYPLMDRPSRTLTTRSETAIAQPPFITEMYGTGTARPTSEPAGTFTAGGNHHGLVVTNQHKNQARDISEPAPTMTTATGGGQALVMSYYSREATNRASDPIATITTEPRHALVEPPFVSQFRDRADRNLDPATEPLRTIVADGANHALITRHNNNRGDQSNLTTPSDEYLRTLTTTAQQSIMQRPGQVTAADLRAAEEMVPEVLFRMFQPHEVAAGMAFPTDYKWQPPDRARPVSNRDLVKAAGNAVTPPAARDIIHACITSLDGALAA